jgi:hypothetical protein
MKYLTSLLTVTLLLFASVAFSQPIRNPLGPYVAIPFNQYTGMASTARYSGAQKVDRNTQKTVVFVGYSTNGTDVLATLPGTAIAQCGPTSSGPWVTSKDVAANTVSATTSTLFNLDSCCPYIRTGWTKTGTGKRSISAYILFGDQ